MAITGYAALREANIFFEGFFRLKPYLEVLRTRVLEACLSLPRHGGYPCSKTFDTFGNDEEGCAGGELSAHGAGLFPSVKEFHHQRKRPAWQS
jgi:hypothetical protein